MILKLALILIVVISYEIYSKVVPVGLLFVAEPLVGKKFCPVALNHYLLNITEGKF